MPENGSTARRGPLAWFAGHHVAANLLMLFVLVAGGLSLASTVIEVFPEFSIDTITISVVYPGSTPAETEEGVVVRIEEAIASIDGIKRIRSTAAEGAGVVSVELEEDADGRRVLDDVKAAVDRIITFPEEIEQPVIAEVVSRREVVSVAVYGDVPKKTLAALAERVRDDLTGTEAISQAEVYGLPPYEISVELSEEKLRRYGLSFSQVADAVRAASLDLPAGGIKTEGGEILLRTQGQMYHGRQFEDIVLLTRGDGTRVLLGDVAHVVDGFADTDVTSRFNGHPAALVKVFRTGDQGVLDISRTVDDYVQELRETAPAGVEVAIWHDASVILRQRIGLLLRNARIGLVLVFLCLALFLDLRLAFWATMGIPISFLGGLWLLPHFDVTINMISLFAFIVSLGIVVDDAIVVGENVFEYRQQGMKALDAAIRGVREMAVPVIFAVLTTVAAFLPLVFVEGLMGKVMRNIPVVVISVLMMSLLECLLILPAHLSGEETPRMVRGLLYFLGPLLRFHEALRARFSRGLEWIIGAPYERLLTRVLRWRYLTVAAAVGILLLTGGVVAGGWIKFTLMPKIDADDMTAFLEMPQGTPVAQTEKIIARMEQAALEVGREFDATSGLSEPLIVHMNTSLGEQPAAGGGHGPLSSGAGSASGGHLGQVQIELLAGETRGISSSELVNRWRNKVGEVPGATSLIFQSTVFSAGDAISVQLADQNFDTLLLAVDRLKGLLAEYPGVTDIADSFVPGKRELKFDVTPEGRALGLTRRELARQVRQGFYGEEAQRIQRGRDELKVMVRYPEAERTSRGDVEAMRIRLADGTEAAFDTVATVEEGRGYATLRRVDRRRVVTVTADVDEEVANAKEINDSLKESVLPALAADFPGLSFDFEGEERERADSMQSLGRNFLVALLLIFTLLAIPFRSYSQPLIIMSVIPFGFVGAIAGHLLMGMNLSMLSFFGMVALTGIVVNDSLILIDQINRMRRDGVSLDEALVSSAQRRFRPILLTTLTTFFGLVPMIFETSLQARFLIPMAISLGFGVLFATGITLLLVPTLYRILEDFHFVFDSSSVHVPEGAGEAAEPGLA